MYVLTLYLIYVLIVSIGTKERILIYNSKFVSSVSFTNVLLKFY